ncbi:hypothetical protein FV226_13230 [Methylobacterium sp. WL12]|uniref:hypothetical protein n=1 Tax=Methylobacterium sp. WL12 TaxID=2603890 RepID=UPI0011CCC078|nr:hypothetical protein [Methylobacterium sp. WL12]TXM72186.1 hypothetical protein FV226_13230 [Methylobacterium sp. WL12]
MSTASNLRRVPTRRSAFVPQIRGDLAQALVSPEAFLDVAPSVPRSVAWLRDRTLAHNPKATVRDIALFEMLVALSVVGVETEDTIRAARMCSVRQASTVLSVGGHSAQPRELVAALERLFDRKPEPLKLGAMFYFHLPGWVVPVQQPGTRYAHIDLAVLARFRRRSSPFLYREILAHIAAERIRYEPGAPPFEMRMPPSLLGDILGMLAPVHVGQLRLRYLDPAVAEIREHVRLFEIVSVADVHQGRAVTEIVLTIRMRPPERLDAVPTRLISETDFSFMSERGDAPAYRVKPATLVRLGSSLPSTVMRRKKNGGANPLLGSEMLQRYDTWLIALNEALTRRALTPGYETGAYRGQRLLDTIERDGADAVFFAFSHAEAAAPDLGPVIAERHSLRWEADAARKARAKASRAAAARERRVEVRNARADGMMAPPQKRRPNREEPMPTAPVQSATEAAHPVLSAEMIAMLSTPEGMAEGDRLYREWDQGFDFPFSHAVKAAERIKAAFQRGDFPILAAVNAAMDNYYLRSLKPILKISYDYVPGLTKTEQEEEASHWVSLLARWWPNRVSLGRSKDPVAEILNDRAVYLRDRARTTETIKSARAAAQARLKAPMPRPETERYINGYQPKRRMPA